MEYKFYYTVYGNNLEHPLARFDNPEDAHADLINFDDGVMVVTEVCEYDKDGKLIIKKQRVREAPMIWFPTTFTPDFDGHFLCWVSVKEECGAEKERAEVILYAFGQWNSLPNHSVKKWMIIKEPVSDK